MKERRALLILVDLALVNIAVLFALGVWAARGDMAFDLAFLLSQSYWFILLSALWVLFAFLNGLYELSAMRNFAGTVAALVCTVVWVVAGYFSIYFLSPPNSLPRLVVFYHGVATLALTLVWRAVYSSLVSKTTFRRRVLVVGAGCSGQTIVEAIREHLESHYQIVGFIDDDRRKQCQEINGVPVLGTREDMIGLIKKHSVSEVVLAITRDVPQGLFRVLLDVQEQGVEITPMPVLYEQITGRVPVDYIGDSWYVSLPLGHASTGSLYPLVKRLLDLVVALVGLVIFGLLLPIVALAIRLDSGGPLFYTQERVGKGGRVFRVRKLRTMVQNAERSGEAVWAAKNDPRVTRVGRLLRKARVDEFPQFLNILSGEMAAVGPRPERPEFVCQLEKTVPFYRLRHAVKPGMAGWAVVNHDYVDSLESARVRVEYDLYYIKHQSFWLDVLILFRMVGQVLALKGR
jgi:exopolysaccharide biosynthesis polyprenyl glycosylphosphotransferase